MDGDNINEKMDSSAMAPSHRWLIHRRNQQILSEAAHNAQPDEASFFSYHALSLVAGQQKISSVPLHQPYDQPTHSHSIGAVSQSFYSLSSKFNLPRENVASISPAPGADAESRVLPHIVIKNPNLPWERRPTYVATDEEEGDKRSRTPWLALLVFTVEELRVDNPKLETIMSPFSIDVRREQSDTFALRMRARDTTSLQGVTNAISFVNEQDASDASEPVDVILLDPKLFSSLFKEDNSDHLSVSNYKYLAHVRQTPTEGKAGTENAIGRDDGTTLSSIVVSPRTPTIHPDAPTTAVVHLVSLDMAPNLKFPLPESQPVAMLSLYSWTYQCRPLKSLESRFDDLKIIWLQLPDAREQSPSLRDDDLASYIKKRQADGYTLIRYRTPTGEETTALTRGPFTPVFVNHPLNGNAPIQSNFGTDLQILDPHLSMMDLTYANAWKLGKALALSDQAFSTALARLRRAIHIQDTTSSRPRVHVDVGRYSSRRDTTSAMLDLVRGLNEINTALPKDDDPSTPLSTNRWRRGSTIGDSKTAINPRSSHQSDPVSTRTSTAAKAVVHRFAHATDGQLYHEYNVPENSDYAHVYSWILDKLHFDQVPAQYLIPDPSYLPQETLRFFFVDENWTGALIDGALSLANHEGARPEEDRTRTAIKAAINERLNTPDPTLGGSYVQMPKYGFLLRSEILTEFPDASIFLEYPRLSNNDNEPHTPQASILVQKRLAPDTIYCLFDHVLSSATCIAFAMPPHQQRFSIGQTLLDNKLVVAYKRVRTEKNPEWESPSQELSVKCFDPENLAPVFNWKTRIMNVENYCQELINAQNAGIDQGDKRLLTSSFEMPSLLAVQLNDSAIYINTGNLNQNLVDVFSNYRFQLSIVPEETNPVPPPK